MTSDVLSMRAAEGDTLCTVITGVSVESKAVDARVGSNGGERDGNLLSTIHPSDAQESFPQAASPNWSRFVDALIKAHQSSQASKPSPLTSKGLTTSPRGCNEPIEARLEAIRSGFELLKLISMPTITQSPESTELETSFSTHKTNPSLPGVDSIGVTGSSQILDPAPLPSSQIGAACEYLVMADLIISGLEPMLSGLHSSPYDLAIEHEGRLLKVQVKGVSEPRSARGSHKSRYEFNIRSNSSRGAYLASDFDLIALVALDQRKITYFPHTSQKFIGLKPDFTPQSIHSALSKLAA